MSVSQGMLRIACQERGREVSPSEPPEGSDTADTAFGLLASDTVRA